MGACPATTWVTVTMTDSGSNGWNGNILGFKQNGTFVGTFGDNFTKGASGGRLSFTFISNFIGLLAAFFSFSVINNAFEQFMVCTFITGTLGVLATLIFWSGVPENQLVKSINFYYNFHFKVRKSIFFIFF